MNENTNENLVDDERFRQIINKKQTFGFFMASIIIVSYLAFILIMAFKPEWILASIAGTIFNFGFLMTILFLALVFIVMAVFVSKKSKDDNSDLHELMAKYNEK